MSGNLKVYSKSVVERRRLYLDYSCWLAEDEELTNFQMTVTPFITEAPVTVDTSYPDALHKRLMMFVSGGKANTTYTLSMVVQTDAGQVKRDDIGLRVTT